MIIICGIIFIIIGIFLFYRSSQTKIFYKKIKDGKLSDYKKIVGIVICDAYLPGNAEDLNRPVTPIVEYEVKGKKYETANSLLETGAELPVGTKVYLWYNKNNPKNAILGIELNNSFKIKSIGILLTFFGVLFIIVNV